MLRLALLSLLSVLTACATSPPRQAVAEHADRAYVAVSVADVDASAAWYRQVLELESLDDQRAPDGRWRIVNLVSERVWVELIFDARDQAVANARGFVKFGFLVADVDAVADRVVAMGAPRPQIGESSQHQVRLLQLRDPDGHIVQFMSPLPASD